MRSFNQTMLMGHLTADPEVRQTKTGKALATFSVATNRDWQTSSDGTKKTATDFHRVVVWGKQAETAGKWLAKGSAVLVIGRLANSSYEGKDGQRKYRTEIVCREFFILTFKKGEKGDAHVEMTSPTTEEDEA